MVFDEISQFFLPKPISIVLSYSSRQYVSIYLIHRQQIVRTFSISFDSSEAAFIPTY